MKKSEKAISGWIILAVGCALAAAASFFALHYNAWFIKPEAKPRTAVSLTDIRDNKIVLAMGMVEIREEDTSLTDRFTQTELKERNLYGFPVGQSPYLIYVEKGAHTLSVFGKDGYGLYTQRIYTWLTATGTSEHLTPSGTFRVGTKEEWHDWFGESYSPYATCFYKGKNIYGGLFIHGPLYKKPRLSSVMTGTVQQIGTSCSSGCLRTEAEAAYFVYAMCPEGTIVRIVDGSPFGFTPDRKVYVYNQTVKPTLENFPVNLIVPEAIAFAQESHTMKVGDVYLPEVVTTPASARNIEGKWTTNNPSIVSVSGQSIRAVGTGSAIITLTTDKGHLTASMLINVVVDEVDTSAEPPDVGRKSVVRNTAEGDGFQPLREDLLTFRINGKEYTINQSVKPLLKALGTPDQFEKCTGCAYADQGDDKQYTYRYDRFKRNGLCTIFTVPILADGGDAICEISIRNYITEDVETTKGIRLGSTRKSVEKAYGTYYTEETVDDETPYIRMTYWAGEPDRPGVPYLCFTLDAKTQKVKGMGIFSGRNIG